MIKETISRLIASPTTPGSGWSPMASEYGKARKHHFYPAKEYRSACQYRAPRSKVPKAKEELPAGTKYCQSCEVWIEKHPNGGRRYNGG